MLWTSTSCACLQVVSGSSSSSSSSSCCCRRVAHISLPQSLSCSLVTTTTISLSLFCVHIVIKTMSKSSSTTRMSSRSGVLLGALLGVVVAILMSATASSAAGAGAARVASHEQGTRFSLTQSQPYHGKDMSGICGDLALWILREADRCLARSLEPFTPTHTDAAPPPSMPEPQSTSSPSSWQVPICAHKRETERERERLRERETHRIEAN